MSKFCVQCGAMIFPAQRADIMNTCLPCGDAIARQEAIRRASCVAPLFNKGPYQYIHSKEIAKDVGR